jgi:hypothetical protein
VQVAVGGFFVKCPQCETRTKVTARGLKFQPLVQCRCGTSYMPALKSDTAKPRQSVVVLDEDGVEVGHRPPPKRIQLNG